MSKSPITCHILDASNGKPASGVKVALECISLIDAPQSGLTALELPHVLSHGETNNDGRCTDLLAHDVRLSPGIYKITFFTGPYFEAAGASCFYPYVEITFTYSNPSQHYHIPLLISPFSYTTYRGS